MNRTSIQWTDFSANPLKYRRKSDGAVVWACVKLSPGCRFCYSESIALRFDRGKVFNAANMEELEPFLDDKELHEMRTRKACDGVPVDGSRVFLADMTDLFGEWVPDALLNRLFSEVLEARPAVTWQVLTKRADRLRRYLSWRWGGGRIPSRNVHVGVSCENQAAADERLPHLLQTPAAVRFVSAEPLLGPLFLRPWLPSPASNWHEKNPSTPRVRWVIAGGESGPHARPCNVEWIHSLVRQCRAAGVACFVKQLGARPEVGDDVTAAHLDEMRRRGDVPRRPVESVVNVRPLKLRDPKGGDVDEFPEDLKVREFPR